VLEIHVKWFLNELLVSLIMPLLSMEKTYSETEQNMSEKQGKGQIMLHLPMKFENHVMNRENEFLRSWSG
jgi:predicted patatin/cPLA2 family phospholipase